MTAVLVGQLTLLMITILAGWLRWAESALPHIAPGAGLTAGLVVIAAGMCWIAVSCIQIMRAHRRLMRELTQIWAMFPRLRREIEEMRPAAEGAATDRNQNPAHPQEEEA